MTKTVWSFSSCKDNMLQTMLKISNSSNSDSSIFSVKFYKIIYKQMKKKIANINICNIYYIVTYNTCEVK